jgi:hypothetical protein
MSKILGLVAVCFVVSSSNLVLARTSHPGGGVHAKYGTKENRTTKSSVKTKEGTEKIFVPPTRR